MQRRLDSADQSRFYVTVVSDDRRSNRNSFWDIVGSSVELSLSKARRQKLSPLLICSRVHWGNVPPSLPIDVTNEFLQMGLPQKRPVQARSWSLPFRRVHAFWTIRRLTQRSSSS